MTMPTTTSHAYSPIFSSANEERSDDSSGDDCAHPSFKNRLAEIPGEVLIEIMKWISLSEGAETSVLSLGCTSKQFSTALKEFGVNSWVRENTLSGKLHKYTTDWVRWHLNRLGTFDLLSEERLRNLCSGLANAAENNRDIENQTWMSLLLVDKRLKASYTRNWFDMLQGFQQNTLSVETRCDEFSMNLFLQVEKALPSHVAMHVIVVGYPWVAPVYDARLADFIKKLCAGKRPICFEFLGVEFIKCPLAQKALTDVLCGQGFIMELYADGNSCPDHLLKGLETCFNQLRHVQLIRIKGLKHIDREAIEDLAEVLERRRDNGGSHVSIALSICGMNAWKLTRKFSLSDEKIAHFEMLGLYLGNLDETLKQRSFVQKFSNSTGYGPVDLVRTKVHPVDSDSDSIVVSSEDDSIIVSSEDELSSDESADEIPVQPQRKPARPSQAEPASEPKVKKRDKCVIS